MKLTLAASLLASAAAFAPASQGKASTALKGYESAPGAIPPVGFFGTFLGSGVDGGRAVSTCVVSYQICLSFRSFKILPG